MKIRGFKLSGHHHHPTRRPKHSAYHRLHHHNSSNQEPHSTELVRMPKSFSHARSFSQLVSALIQFFDNCGVPADGAGGRVSQRPPKGHLAVYVGMDDEWRSHRFYVPVVYVNHPLFVELLEEAEQEYRLHHRGGITIPSRTSGLASPPAGASAAESRPWIRVRPKPCL